MALSATVYNIDVELADVDRQVYDTLPLRVACHPSEAPEHLVARLLARCLEHAEGIGFSRGLAEPDEPALHVRDLTGALRAWIDVGLPDPLRLHRASKASPRVAVYMHKEPRVWLRSLAEARIHRADALELYALDRELVADLADRLDRRTAWGVMITDRHLYVTVGGQTLDAPIERLTLG